MSASRTPGFRTLGHGTVLVEGPPILVVDPWRWREASGIRADVVLVTDPRIDHCSPEDVAAAGGGTAIVLCPAGAGTRLTAAAPGRVVALAESDEWRAPGVVVRALPAEGVARARGFLPPGLGLSYLVTTGGLRWLFLGASAAGTAHEGLAPDVAFVAVGDFTTPTPDEAAEAVARIRPRLAVPTHWGDLSARFDAARRFVELAETRGVAAVPVGGADANPGDDDPGRGDSLRGDS